LFPTFNNNGTWTSGFHTRAFREGVKKLARFIKRKRSSDHHAPEDHLFPEKFSQKEIFSQQKKKPSQVPGSGFQEVETVSGSRFHVSGSDQGNGHWQCLTGCHLPETRNLKPETVFSGTRIALSPA
jgi:hypothetical protein